MNLNKNKKQLECELRGPITWSDFFDIKKRLEENYGEFVCTKELAIFIKGDYDLRVKINNSKGSKFVYKKSIGINDYKKEVEIDIKETEILKLIEILSSIGFNNSVYSYVEKYNAKKDNKSFSVKFGSKIGDFFEIETLLVNEKDIDNATLEMKNYIKKIGLNLWSNEAYNEVLKSSWKNEKEEPMFNLKSNCFNKIIIESIEQILQKESVLEKTIKEILELTENDYSKEEERFFNVYKQNLVSKNIISGKHISTKTSIVIPTFNSKETLSGTLLSINNQKLTKKERGLLEVIVVDDGSDDNTGHEIYKQSYNFELKYIKQNHIGRGSARNIGVSISSGEIIIFLDADVIIDENFVREHTLRHEVIEKGVFISFKENIKIEQSNIIKFVQENKKPNIKNDFRFFKKVDSEWLRMHRHVRSVESREVEILKETNNFKTFGLNRVCGVWDLSSMIVTCAISLKKSEFINCGGFNLQFKGWGMEDTFLGACLIVRGNFMIPVFSTGVFHIKHKTRSKDETQKIKEFNKNVLVYLDLVNQRANKVIRNLNNKG